METTDLTLAMNAATAELAPRPGFTEDVLRGGRRRTNRRRIGGALVLAAVVGVVTITTVNDGVPLTDNTPAAPHSDWQYINRPTGGDLADNQAYLAKVRQAWETGVADSPNNWSDHTRIGEAKIVWAGTTPAGPAALVAQGVEPNAPMRQHGPENPPGGLPVLGLVAGETPRLVSERPPSYTSPVAFLFGPDDRMLLTLDRGQPLRWSSWTEDVDGTGSHTWQELPTADGVGVTQLPAGASPTAFVVQGTADIPERTVRSVPVGDIIGTLPASSYHLGVDKQSKTVPARTADWNLTVPLDNGPERELGLLDPFYLLLEAGYADPQSLAAVQGGYFIAELPGGGTVRAFEFVPYTGSGSRFYAVVTRPDSDEKTVVHGGPIRPGESPQATVRLPDGLGWAVAAPEATVAYRTGPDQLWQQAGVGGVLVPATATHVQVARPNQAPIVTELH